jgi:hypothetical protein
MTTKQLDKFLQFLAQQNIVWAPQKIDGQLVIEFLIAMFFLITIKIKSNPKLNHLIK